jgi:ATP:ADP antiporter, AAA family
MLPGRRPAPTPPPNGIPSLPVSTQNRPAPRILRQTRMTAILQRFVDVRREEIPPLLASALFFFCVLTALMVLRPARDAIGMQGGMDAIRWLFVGTAVVTLAVNPVFGFLVSRFRRLFFISATYLFFAASLFGFYLLITVAPQAVGDVSGRVFYIWFSVFNLFSTMVFWALMADRYSLEQSKRLFAVVAVGGTLGAIFGPWLALRLAEPFGTPSLFLVAVGFLGLAVGAAWLVAWLQPKAREAVPTADPEAPPAVDERAVIGGSAWEGMRAALRSPYLGGIATYVLLAAIAATFIYFTRLQMVDALQVSRDEQTAAFARIDFYVQLTTLVLQLLVAGRLMKRFGVAFTLALFPITVALGFVGLAIVGTFAALVVVDAVFRAVQRAIMRPARETLFTVVPRADKYKSKAFIDTFVWRGGDVVGAFTEGFLARLGLGLLALTGFIVPMAIAWAALGIWLGRAQLRVAAENARPLRSREGEAVGV